MPAKEPLVRRLFDLITPRYDLFNRVASLGLDQGWRARAIESLQLAPGMRVLDLASGTGDLAALAAERLAPLGTVVACDLSHPMLAQAQRKLSRQPAACWHVQYTQARAEALPFADSSFEAATIGFALRNVSDLEAAFREFRRVVRPGGRLALLEFGRPAQPLLRLGHWFWLTGVIPLLGILATGRLWPFLYLRRSILGFASPGEVSSLLKEAGFPQVAVRPIHGGIAVLYAAQLPP